MRGEGLSGGVYLRWSKTFCTPVFTDGLDAFVFGFSFLGLRISRFDFCCFDMGMVTSQASQPAMRFAPVGRRPEWSIRQGQRQKGFADFSVTWAAKGVPDISCARLGNTMGKCAGWMTADASKNPSPGWPEEGLLSISTGQGLFARAVLLFRNARLLLRRSGAGLAGLGLARLVLFLFGHDVHSLSSNCLPALV